MVRKGGRVKRKEWHMAGGRSQVAGLTPIVRGYDDDCFVEHASINKGLYDVLGGLIHDVKRARKLLSQIFRLHHIRCDALVDV